MVKPRNPVPTVKFVDTYCQLYQNIFVEVRAYEYFKYLHVGIISDLKRKSLPAIAKIVGLDSSQGLHHFLSESPWKSAELEKRRLEIILTVLEGREIDLIIDETGDKKKGKKTDYVKRQYIGNLGKIEQGIVSVNAYGYCEGMTFPLKCKVYKPQERLKEGDLYKSKPELGAEIIKELLALGFKVKRVLADSLYGESRSNFLRILEKLKLDYKDVGNIYGIRAWIEYGFKQSKNELGWADFRVTHYEQIEKWWEIVMSAYLTISLHNDSFSPSVSPVEEKFREHDWWDEQKGWKNLLNNLRLILQPSVSFHLIIHWLKVFPIPQLYEGFSHTYFPNE